MTKGKIAATSPTAVDLEEGKQYAFCTCGLSESKTFCDGSHKGSDFKPLVFTAEKTEKAFLCDCKQTDKAPFCDGTHSGLEKT